MVDKWDNFAFRLRHNQRSRRICRQKVFMILIIGILKKAKRRAGIKEDDEAAKKLKHKLI